MLSSRGRPRIQVVVAVKPSVPVFETLRDTLPFGTWLGLVLAWAVVAAFQLWGHSWLAAPIAVPVAVACFLILFSIILLAAFGIVREADHLAHALGEPYGTLILTLSIVSIEVILISAVMAGPGPSATIGRDAMFAVMMIILNLVMGLCLFLGGLRYGEQEYNAQGAAAYLSMIIGLTGIALVLPNAVSTGDGTFAPSQAVPISVLTLILYAAFLAMQMRSYRRFFVQPEPGLLASPLASVRKDETRSGGRRVGHSDGGDSRAIWIRSIVLVALLVPIVLLSHDLAVLIDLGIAYAGAPVAVGGVIIAIIVFTPESITAVRAALANQVQRAVNLCLGAFLSTVGLTVPAVLVIGLIMDKPVVLGLSRPDTVLLVLTIAISTVTFLGLRTSSIQGMTHLMLFAVFVVLLFSP